jgi:hypothetical protein
MGAGAACGKRGNPMPPLQRIPAAPADLSVQRIEDQVYARFTVPTANVDGQGPADVARVELYAITLNQLPSTLSFVAAEDLREAATLVAARVVRPPLPPPVPVEEGAAPVPLPPRGPGIDQGTVVVERETLTPESRTAATLPEQDIPSSLIEEEAEVPRPFGATAQAMTPKRYYFAVSVSRRGRYGPHSGLVPAPLGPTSGAPSEPVIEVAEKAMTLRWTPPPDARGIPAEPDAGLLPSRPTVPGPPATVYEVYEARRNPEEAEPVTIPAPLTPEPLTVAEFTEGDIRLGVERCFYVRAVDTIDGLRVRGPASPVACSDFADTFPPSPPHELVAISVAGAISLIWEPSDTEDVAGYVVLRGEVGSDTLTPLTTSPVTGLSYRDETVRAGVRYVYVAVAVDAAGNRSEPSNRAEETAQ